MIWIRIWQKGSDPDPQHWLWDIRLFGLTVCQAPHHHTQRDQPGQGPRAERAQPLQPPQLTG